MADYYDPDYSYRGGRDFFDEGGKLKKYWIVCGDPDQVGSHKAHIKYDTLQEAKAKAESCFSPLTGRANQRICVYELVGVVKERNAPVEWTYPK